MNSVGGRTARTHRVMSYVLLAVALVVASGAALSPAHAAPTIQPGAAAYPAHTPLGPASPCTLNFVFTDARHTYIGTAGRCTYEVGERVGDADNVPFGTVVYRVFTGTDEVPDKYLGPLDQSAIDDFALIRVDRDKVRRVSPVVLGVGRAPTGFTRSAETTDGEALTMTGQGVGLSAHGSTRTRAATLVTDDARNYAGRWVGSAGDPGAPLIRDLDGKALGVVSALGVPNNIGTTIERISSLLRDGGFRVRLVTERRRR